MANTGKPSQGHTRPMGTNDGFYYEAARIVAGVLEGKARIKNLCYNSKQRNKKALFAITTETLKSK